MATFNDTGSSHSLYSAGVPGLEDQHAWISPLLYLLPGCSLWKQCPHPVINTERSLYEPMYPFLCAGWADLILSPATVPKALAIRWLHAGAISLDGCATQILFIHCHLHC